MSWKLGKTIKLDHSYTVDRAIKLDHSYTAERADEQAISNVKCISLLTRKEPTESTSFQNVNHKKLPLCKRIEQEKMQDNISDVDHPLIHKYKSISENMSGQSTAKDHCNTNQTDGRRNQNNNENTPVTDHPVNVTSQDLDFQGNETLWIPGYSISQKELADLGLTFNSSDLDLKHDEMISEKSLDSDISEIEKVKFDKSGLNTAGKDDKENTYTCSLCFRVKSVGLTILKELSSIKHDHSYIEATSIKDDHSYSKSAFSSFQKSKTISSRAKLSVFQSFQDTCNGSSHDGITLLSICNKIKTCTCDKRKQKVQNNADIQESVAIPIKDNSTNENNCNTHQTCRSDVSELYTNIKGTEKNSEEFDIDEIPTEFRIIGNVYSYIHRHGKIIGTCIRDKRKPGLCKAMCKFCDYVNFSMCLKSRKRLRLHYGKKHVERQLHFHCDVCSKKFGLMSELNEHKKKHKFKTCEICGKLIGVTNFPVHFYRCHNPNNNPDNKYECDICKKKYATKSNMKAHIKLNHTIDRQVFTCQICKTNRLLQSSLTNHMISAHGSKEEKESRKKFICDICGMAFLNYYYMKNHRERHINQVPKFDCDICGKRFHTKKGISDHLKRHSDIKEHLCSYCGKTFSQFNCLKLHLRIHKEKHLCSHCGKAFTNLFSLRRHLQIHTVHLCSYCGKTFTQFNCLQRHLRIHTGERPYSCTVCSKSYRANRDLQAHKIKKHDVHNHDNVHF